MSDSAEANLGMFDSPGLNETANFVLPIPLKLTPRPDANFGWWPDRVHGAASVAIREEKAR